MAKEPNKPSGIADTLANALEKVSSTALDPLRQPTTVQGQSIQGTVLAYQALSRIANRIATAVAATWTSPPASKRGALLLAGSEIPGVDELNACRLIIAHLRSALQRADTTAGQVLGTTEYAFFPAAALLPVVPALVQAAVWIAGGLRTETTIQHYSITLDDQTLVASVAKCLREGGVDVATLLRPQWAAQADSELVKSIDELRQGAEKARRTIKDIDALSSDESAEAARIRGEREAAKAALEAAAEAVDTFWSSLQAASQTKGSGLGMLMRTEALLHHIGLEGRIVTLKVLAGGGSSLMEAKLGRDPVYHAGGAVATYMTFDPKGAVLDSDILTDVSRLERDDKLFPTTAT